MKKREVVCIAAEVIGEAAIGLTIAILKNGFVDPKLNKTCKVIVDIGTIPLAWMIGRAFGKTFYKFCDGTFGTEFQEKYQIDKI